MKDQSRRPGVVDAAGNLHAAKTGRFAGHVRAPIEGLDLDEDPGVRVEYESIPWVPEAEVPHRHRLTFAGPYRAAIPARISEITLRLTPALVELTADASAEIARFDAENTAGVAPFAAILLRSESVASSRIENLTASAKAIGLAELGDTSKRNASVIVANVNAMRAAIALADRIDGQAILDMHEALLGAEHPEWCGRWRTQQVWIGGGDYGPHTARFVPPHHTRVPAAIEDLVEFMRRTDVMPLAQAAVAHAQFETIHPFPDGNGRTGRALVHSLLRHRRLTRSVTVPVSAGLLTDTGAYFDGLTAYREGDLEPIIEQFAHASHRAVHNGRSLISDLRSLRAGWKEVISARRGAAAHGVADLLLRQPVIDSALIQRELGVSTPTALAAVDHLVAADVIRQISDEKWGRKWAAHGVLAALDAYAERAGRRAH